MSFEDRAAAQKLRAHVRADQVDAFTAELSPLIRKAWELGLGPVEERLEVTANELRQWTAAMRALADQGHFTYQEIP